jgi:hypothetical protein
VQIYVAISIASHWKVRRSERPARSVQVFWAANLALCVGYIVSALIALACFSIKLDLARYVSVKLDGSCPQGFVDFVPVLCLAQDTEQKVGGILQALDVMQIINSVIVHCVFIGSDLLLVTLSLIAQSFMHLIGFSQVYRCYLMLETPWIITGLSILPLLACFGE